MVSIFDLDVGDFGIKPCIEPPAPPPAPVPLKACDNCQYFCLQMSVKSHQGVVVSFGN